MKTRSIQTIALFFSFIILISSCKKKDSPSPDTASSNTNTSGYYGVLSSFQFNVLQGGTLTSNQGISNAVFSSNVMINNGVVNNSYLDGGDVTLNNILFKKTTSTSFSYYSDSTHTILTPPNSWQVSGSANVSAISFTNTNSYPTYTGYSSLADTIKLGQNNTISLSGISGADQIEVHFTDYPQLHTSTLKYVSGTTSSVTFSSSEMNTLTTTNTGFITVICMKDTFQTFGGKSYKFQTGYQLQKLNVVFE